MGKGRLETVTGWLGQLRHFITEILKATVSPKPAINRLRTIVHFFVLVWRGFVDNRCPIRAAALSYTTLLALVPIMVVVLNFSQTVLHESSAQIAPKLTDKVLTVLAPELEAVPASADETNKPAGDEHTEEAARSRKETVDHIQQYINNINAGALGTVGTIFLVFVGIRLLITIEQTFNDIWGIREGRSLWRKVVYYWATVTLRAAVVDRGNVLEQPARICRPHAQRVLYLRDAGDVDVGALGDVFTDVRVAAEHVGSARAA